MPFAIATGLRRVGDHRWCVSDLTDRPSWGIVRAPEDTLLEIYERNPERWKAASPDGTASRSPD
jgi:hypothetical protein